MTYEDLEELMLAVSRYRTQMWVNDPKISDLECWLYTSAMMYDMVRAIKVQLDIIRHPERWGERGNPESAKEALEKSLGITFGGPIPDVETFWPYAISKGVIERMTEQNYN